MSFVRGVDRFPGQHTACDRLVVQYLVWPDTEDQYYRSSTVSLDDWVRTIL